MKVLVLTKYDRRAASARVRFEKFAPGLAAHGIDLQLSPLLGETYLERMFAGAETSRLGIASAYLRRLRTLLGAGRYDLLLVQYELFPYLPALAEMLVAARVPYVVDYDDAIFHHYDLHRHRAVRWLLGPKIPAVMRKARAVLVGSRYLQQFALRHNDRVHLIPSVVDLERYRAEEPPDRPYTLGWIGSPSSFENFPLIEAAVAAAAELRDFRLLTVGAPPVVLSGVQVEARPWQEEREVDDLLDMDVGLMPLQDRPFQRGKCAFKLIQYMACARPTISSPVGANREVVGDEAGLFPTTHQAWIEAIVSLCDHPERRRTMGRAGRAKVERELTVNRQVDRFAAALLEAVT